MSEKEQKQWYVVRAIGGKEKRLKSTSTTKYVNHTSKTISPKF